MITGKTNQAYFVMFLADFFYPEAVPNSQLFHHVFCVSIILKITYFSIATFQWSFPVASPFLICEGKSPNAGVGTVLS